MEVYSWRRKKEQCEGVKSTTTVRKWTRHVVRRKSPKVKASGGPAGENGDIQTEAVEACKGTGTVAEALINVHLARH